MWGGEYRKNVFFLHRSAMSNIAHTRVLPLSVMFIQHAPHPYSVVSTQHPRTSGTEGAQTGHACTHEPGKAVQKEDLLTRNSISAAEHQQTQNTDRHCCTTVIMQSTQSNLPMSKYGYIVVGGWTTYRWCLSSWQEVGKRCVVVRLQCSSLWADILKKGNDIKNAHCYREMVLKRNTLQNNSYN